MISGFVLRLCSSVCLMRCVVNLHLSFPCPPSHTHHPSSIHSTFSSFRCFLLFFIVQPKHTPYFRQPINVFDCIMQSLQPNAKPHHPHFPSPFPTNRATPVDLSVYFKNEFLRQKRQLSNSAHQSSQNSQRSMQPKSSVLSILSKQKKMNDITTLPHSLSHKKSFEQLRLPLIQAVVFTSIDQPKKPLRHISPIEQISILKKRRKPNRYEFMQDFRRMEGKGLGHMSVELERRIESELRLDQEYDFQVLSKDQAVIARSRRDRGKIDEVKVSGDRWEEEKEMEVLRKNRRKVKRNMEKVKRRTILRPWETIDSQHENQQYAPDFQ